MTGKPDRSCKASTLRLAITAMWIAFWAATSIAVIASPKLRADHQILADSVLPLLGQVASVWLPCVSCLVGFWFTNQPSRRNAPNAVSCERALIAVLITASYLIFAFAVLMIPIYWLHYDHDTIAPPLGTTIVERMADSVKYALLVSPLALAPINWLTGTHDEPESAVPSAPGI
jgi:hypothetical protein